MASDQQFCLRWNNHQSTLVSVFDNLLESQTLVDCTLAADGQYLKAHKVVLSACSPYLEAILCQNLDKHPILILKDVKFSELKAMLDYMYRGEVNISQEQLSTFLKAAESLQIKGLTDSGGGGSSDRDRDPLKRQDLRKPLNQPVPHIPQPRPVVPHPGLMERRSLPHFPPHIADMQPQSPRHAREGSTSPTARKRRRPNRPSSDDSNFVSTPNSLSENQPDTSDSCDVPVKQAASSTPNVPNATTKAPETDSNRTTPQPQNNQQNSEQKQQVTVKKEFSEALLTPKTEFDYGNDNSMEDVTYEDDEEEEVDLSKPGTSFAANSQGFPPWQMGGDGSNDDSNNMYSPDVTAATNQNNSQDQTTPHLEKSPRKTSIESGINTKSRGRIVVQNGIENDARTQNDTDIVLKNQFDGISPIKSPGKDPKSKNKISGLCGKGKRVVCPKCDEYVLKRVIRLHKKYYCGKKFEEKKWKIVSGSTQCLRCNKIFESESIEFHVRYVCGKIPISVQCFYCPRLLPDCYSLLKHMNAAHKKRHCFLDLLSILPVADEVGSESSTPKIVKNFFSIMLNTEQEAIVSDDEVSVKACVQLRNKTTHKCEMCGKTLVGTHEYANHVNTNCGSDKYYSCFVCDFKSVFVYEVLDHMEECHEKLFNTFDIIQAQLTGITPCGVDQPSDKVRDANESSDSFQTCHGQEEDIKRLKTAPCEATTRPTLCTGKRYSDNDHLVNGDVEQSGNVSFESLENENFSPIKCLVKDKLVNIKSSDVDLDTSSKREKEQFPQECDVTSCSLNIKKKHLNGSLKNELVSVEKANKVNIDETKVILNVKSLSKDNNLANSNQTLPDNDKNSFNASRFSPNGSTMSDNHKEKSGSSPQSLSVNGTISQSYTNKGSTKRRFSPRDKSREVRAKHGSNSPEGTKTKKSPTKSLPENENCTNNDPEVDFANKQLFEPYCSPSLVGSPSSCIQDKYLQKTSRSKTKQRGGIGTLGGDGVGENISSDSEVDFANKELFEPYTTPKKDKRSTPSKTTRSTLKNEINNKTESPKNKVGSSITFSGMTSDKNTKTLENSGKESGSPKIKRVENISSSTRIKVRHIKKSKSIMALRQESTRKASLTISKRRIVIGKKIVKFSGQAYKRAVKINCHKCLKDVHPGDLRIHNKYHCLKEPVNKKWILYSGKALCLKCRKLLWSDLIDFHVKHICNKEKFPIQCLYCPKIGKDFKSIIAHMAKGHGKQHYYQDFMTILPDSDDASPEKTQKDDPVKGVCKKSTNTLKHPTHFYAKKIDKELKEEGTGSSTDQRKDYYNCCHCEFKHTMAYKTLDHMEEAHNKEYSLYDLLYAKLSSSDPNNTTNTVESDDITT